MRVKRAFVEAARKARKAGTCPVLMLDEFYRNHMAFDDLCVAFSCKECRVTRDDLVSRVDDDGGLSLEDCTIPF